MRLSNSHTAMQLRHPVTESIRQVVLRELRGMAYVLNAPLSASPFSEISAEAGVSLDRIASYLNYGEIIPAGIRTSEEDAQEPTMNKVLRIGLYPVSADPFHWAHLLIGLSALARFKLDKVIYILSGFDARKPEITSPATRHSMGRLILNMFAPLFDYSPAAVKGDLDGESSVFKVLAANPDQRIDAFYIAGTDHCHRVDPATGNVDTIQKLEHNMRSRIYGFDRKKHSISLIFVKRRLTESSISTSLNLSFMPGVPFESSSTAIRRAFAGRESRDKLALLPYTAYLYIEALGLYAPERQVEHTHGSLPVKRVA
jgi:nicotinic acid mononucleotide adenylyltransferase